VGGEAEIQIEAYRNADSLLTAKRAILDGASETVILPDKSMQESSL
jgi:hypothetical protein